MIDKLTLRGQCSIRSCEGLEDLTCDLRCDCDSWIAYFVWMHHERHGARSEEYMAIRGEQACERRILDIHHTHFMERTGN